MDLGPTPDEPPLLRLFSHAAEEREVAVSEHSPVLPFRVADTILSVAKGTETRLSIAVTDARYQAEDCEGLTEIEDTFMTELDPNHVFTREEFAVWAEGTESVAGTTHDDTHRISLSYDGAVRSVSFERRLRQSRLLYFDHHHPDDPPDTNSCCKQMLAAIEEGHFIPVADSRVPHLIRERLIDCDEDVCLTRWLSRNWRKLLANPEILERVRPLVELEDQLDVYAGMVPIDFSDTAEGTLFRQQVWIFKPFSLWRKAGKKPDEMLAVLEEVGKRLDAYAEGNAQLEEVDTNYTELSGGFGWKMIDEGAGQQARQELINESRIVMTTREVESERWRYTIGQVHEKFLSLRDMPVMIDLEGLCEYLNLLEKIPAEATDRWGGRKGIVIGSPKKSNSTLDPERLTEIVKMFLYPQNPPGKQKTSPIHRIFDQQNPTEEPLRRIA